ncbi:MAG: molybdenum cofactor guanylyltransferase [Armatimonadota bacterium]|nr:molybdenum cofactor guanylyltransferase [Armatimonadota bacterium]
MEDLHLPEMTAIVLAGGLSRRMGQNKALLDLGGRTLIEHLFARIQGLFSEVLLVTDRPEVYRSLGVRIVRDLWPKRHPLVGIYSGLAAASTEYGFVFACDMPFLNRDLIAYMMRLAPGYDVVVPHHAGGFEPLHAVYGKACLDPIAQSISHGDQVTGFFSKVRVREVSEAEITRFDPEMLSFSNLNTPEEYARALGQLNMRS